MGTVQLPLEAAPQVNIFGEASSGVLLQDINGIEAPGPISMIYCVYHFVCWGDNFGMH